MNEVTTLQVEAAELRGLLERSADDPILGPQLRKRLVDAEKRLSSAQRQPGTILPKEIATLPRAAIFLRGGGVQGSEGIRASLAGDLLQQYERMFAAQAVHDERVAAKMAGRQRRPRGATNPGLWFIGTPRGSFGLEFTPQATEDQRLVDVQARSLRSVAEALSRVAGGGAQSLDDVLSEIPPRVLQPLKQFLKVLSQNQAELRLALDAGPSRSLSAAEISNAAERLEREVDQETVTLKGIFRGVTMESGGFDLLTDGGLVKGTVADDLTEEDLERIHKLTNQQCLAELQKTVVRKIGGAETVGYVLLNAHRVK